MVGNAYPYTVDNWVNDIKLASSAGMYVLNSIHSIQLSHPPNSDAFALNIGTDAWQQARVNDAYTAAQKCGSNFKMFISFDMTVLPCASSSDAGAIRKYINQYASHPAQFMYNGKALFSSFSGETCQFGTGSVGSGWSSVFGGTNSLFVPSFFMDPSQFSTLSSVMNGAFNVSHSQRQ